MSRREEGDLQKSRASSTTTFTGLSESASAFERWYAADVPVIPDPTIQTSASVVNGPSLPCAGSGFTFGPRSQNDSVEFATGRTGGSAFGGRSSTCCCGRGPTLSCMESVTHERRIRFVVFDAMASGGRR